ncbi:MAG TPA: hypothetical protein VFV19_02980 [Candidatus Polarisedimenticolaceae bacterium]|nr:hypothetical protein [Candidatus Polarisedimenticolaceae bacterium]
MALTVIDRNGVTHTQIPFTTKPATVVVGGVVTPVQPSTPPVNPYANPQAAGSPEAWANAVGWSNPIHNVLWDFGWQFSPPITTSDLYTAGQITDFDHYSYTARGGFAEVQATTSGTVPSTSDVPATLQGMTYVTNQLIIVTVYERNWLCYSGFYAPGVFINV